jgi:hypothetical protein
MANPPLSNLPPSRCTHCDRRPANWLHGLCLECYFAKAFDRRRSAGRGAGTHPHLTTRPAGRSMTQALPRRR